MVCSGSATGPDRVSTSVLPCFVANLRLVQRWGPDARVGGSKDAYGSGPHGHREVEVPPVVADDPVEDREERGMLLEGGALLHDGSLSEGDQETLGDSSFARPEEHDEP